MRKMKARISSRRCASARLNLDIFSRSRSVDETFVRRNIEILQNCRQSFYRRELNLTMDLTLEVGGNLVRRNRAPVGTWPRAVLAVSFVAGTLLTQSPH